MKKRNQFIKRIGAFLCAVAVAVSCFGVASPYFAVNENVNIQTFLSACGLPQLPEYNPSYKYVFADSPKDGYESVFVYVYEKGGDFVNYGISSSGDRPYAVVQGSNVVTYSIYKLDLENGATEWEKVVSSFEQSGHIGASSLVAITSHRAYYSELVLYTNYKTLNDVYYEAGHYYTYDYGLTDVVEIPTCVYNSSLGYLQNIERKTTYIRGALYNYDEDSKTYHWYHDLLSSTGVDLTSGDYVIRHYVSEATVKGYEKEDIVRMSDKFLMAEYDASKGYFSYLVKDYDSKLYELGYEELGFIDTYFRGYFVLEHHYFQIVNIATNEVGGYLHLYPRDADPDNFGVELEYEGLDNNFEVDSDAPSGNTKPSTGSGEMIEDALVNADEPKLDDLQGIDEFIGSLEMYSEQIKGVVGGVSAFLGMFPPWLIGLVGFSLVMPFVVIVIKALRG